MENLAHSFVAESRPGFTAEPYYIQTVRVIEQLDHALRNLIDVSYLDKKPVTFLNDGGDSADSCR